jgi:hypothetical protein
MGAEAAAGLHRGGRLGRVWAPPHHLPRHLAHAERRASTAPGVEAVVMSAGELESEVAGKPGRLIRDRYRKAADMAKVRRRGGGGRAQGVGAQGTRGAAGSR